MTANKLKNDWGKLVSAAKEKMKFYCAMESFYIGDVVSHKKYGPGIVQSSFSNKIEVLFQDQARTLVHKVLF